MSRKTLELLDYNLLVSPKGAINNGIDCHFNSLIQSLLSCTSITNYFLKFEDRLLSTGGKCEEKKETFMRFIDMLKMQLNPDVKFLDARALLSTITKNSSNSFGHRQEDVNEGFMLLMDALGDDVLSNYFRHVYKVSTYCFTCKNIVCVKVHNHQLFIDIPLLKLVEKKDQNGRTIEYLTNGYTAEMIGNFNIDDMDPLNRYIKQMKSATDRKCPRCTFKTCVDIYQLDHLSDILVLLFKKYDRKNQMNFPPIMTFKASKNGQPETRYYKLVAQMEHRGGRDGGHYYATCLRKNGYVTLNDVRITPNPNPVPTKFTYMVFYHIFDPAIPMPTERSEDSLGESESLKENIIAEAMRRLNIT